MVLAASLGLVVHFGPIIASTFGIFLKPLSAEFGWSRSQISLAFTAAVLGQVLAQSFVGRWSDRYGARTIILSASVLFGAVVVSLFALTASLWHFYAVFFLTGLVGSGTTPVPYSKVITQWFDRRRGLALALAVTGSSIGSMLIPPLTQSMIGQFGWRVAYVVNGLLAIVVTLPVVGFLLRNTRPKSWAWSQMEALRTTEQRRLPKASRRGSRALRRGARRPSGCSSCPSSVCPSHFTGSCCTWCRS